MLDYSDSRSARVGICQTAEFGLDGLAGSDED